MSSSRDRVLQELLATEEVYVRALDSAMLIMSELTQNSHGLAMSDVPLMFSNLPAISSFHKTFLQTLKDSTSVNEVAEIFLKYAPFMKMYTSYLTGYEQSVRVLTGARAKKSKDWNEYHEALRHRFQSDLPSLLIQPVQRIPRYVMLLAQLRKFSEESDPVYEKLEESRQKIDDIAQHINEWKRQSESLAKLVSIQNKVSGALPADFTLVEPHRRIVREGNVSKQSGGRVRQTTKSRTVFLFTDVLMWTTPTYKFKAYLHLDGMTVKPVGENAFMVKTKDKKSEKFDCSSEADRDSWVEEIQKHIEARDQQVRDRARSKGSVGVRVPSRVNHRLRVLQDSMSRSKLETPTATTRLKRSNTDTQARPASQSDVGQRRSSTAGSSPSHRPRNSVPSMPEFLDDEDFEEEDSLSSLSAASSPSRASSRSLPPVPKFNGRGGGHSRSTSNTDPPPMFAHMDRLMSGSEMSSLDSVKSEPGTPRSSNKTRYALRESRLHLIHKLSQLGNSQSVLSGSESDTSKDNSSEADFFSDQTFEAMAASEVAHIAGSEAPEKEWFEMLIPMKSGAIRQMRRDSLASVSSAGSEFSMPASSRQSTVDSPSASCRSHSSLASLAHEVNSDGTTRSLRGRRTESVESIPFDPAWDPAAPDVAGGPSESLRDFLIASDDGSLVTATMSGGLPPPPPVFADADSVSPSASPLASTPVASRGLPPPPTTKPPTVQEVEAAAAAAAAAEKDKAAAEAQAAAVADKEEEEAATEEPAKDEAVVDEQGEESPQADAADDKQKDAELRLATAVALRSGSPAHEEKEAAAESDADGVSPPPEVELPASPPQAATPLSTPMPSIDVKKPAEESPVSKPRVASPRGSTPLVTPCELTSLATTETAAPPSQSPKAAAAAPKKRSPGSGAAGTPANTPMVTAADLLDATGGAATPATPAPSRENSTRDLLSSASSTTSSESNGARASPEHGAMPANTPAQQGKSDAPTPASTPGVANGQKSGTDSPPNAAQSAQTNGVTLNVPSSSPRTSRLMSPVLAPPSNGSQQGTGVLRSPALVVTSPRIEAKSLGANGEQKAEAAGDAAATANGDSSPSTATETSASSSSAMTTPSKGSQYLGGSQNTGRAAELARKFRRQSARNDGISNILERLNATKSVSAEKTRQVAEKARQAAEKAREESDGKVFSRKSVTELRKLFEQKAHEAELKQQNLSRVGRKPQKLW